MGSPSSRSHGVGSGGTATGAGREGMEVLRGLTRVDRVVDVRRLCRLCASVVPEPALPVGSGGPGRAGVLPLDRESGNDLVRDRHDAPSKIRMHPRRRATTGWSVMVRARWSVPRVYCVGDRRCPPRCGLGTPDRLSPAGLEGLPQHWCVRRHSRTAGFQSSKSPRALSFLSHACSTYSGKVGADVTRLRTAAGAPVRTRRPPADVSRPRARAGAVGIHLVDQRLRLLDGHGVVQQRVVDVVDAHASPSGILEAAQLLQAALPTRGLGGLHVLEGCRRQLRSGSVVPGALCPDRRRCPSW